MNEQEWQACAGGDDTGEMEDYLQGKGSPRTLRLFACACCRRIEASLTDPRSRRAVEVAEQYADGAAGDGALAEAWQQADRAATEVRDAAVEGGDLDAADGSGASRPYYAALAAHWAAIPASSPPEEQASHAAFYALRSAAPPLEEAAAQGRLLADILGRPPSPDRPRPDWLTSTALSLAEGIYGEEAFDRMPVLADALEEAGCSDPELLGHLRGPGPHVRGCWALDLVLGKQ